MRYKGAKGKAWEAVRKYIVARDGGKCITCPKTKDQGWQMQAGHFQPVGYVGSNSHLSWDERNIHCQCAYCNGPGQGRTDVMEHALIKKLGKETIAELQALSHRPDPNPIRGDKMWLQIKEEYEEKLKVLKVLHKK